MACPPFEMSSPAPATVLHAASSPAEQINNINAINLFTIPPPLRRFIHIG
jgi:hypothetical protein